MTQPDVPGFLQFRLKLGFSAMDACTRCGREEETAWINAEDPFDLPTSTGAPAISLYLCRTCLLEAISRTYEEGRIDWQELRSRIEDFATDTDPAPIKAVFMDASMPVPPAAALVGRCCHTFDPDGVLERQGHIDEARGPDRVA